MNQSEQNSSPARHVAVAVRGVVQGVGFRPFVFQLAQLHKLGGWVRNEADTVCLDIQGELTAVEAFLDTLRKAPPSQARIDHCEVRELSCLPEQPAHFEIRPSEGRSAPQPVIPADLATCPWCAAEIFDPAQRRYLYPFTNCTNCGPRWSIIERLPYDRPQTAMKTFPLCPACRAEYENPADRRFHAQPIACPRCGPQLELVDPQGAPLAREHAALEAAVRALLAGKILALKGLGGFQLLVDATNPEAVERLRARKRRPHRPFAIMIGALEEIRRHCRVSPEEAQLLTSSQSPIVLLQRKEIIQQSAVSDQPSAIRLPPSAFHLPSSLAPGNPYLGVMLPYTPLHHLLLHFVSRPVVCTSGNLSEEPMAVANEEALKRLGPLVDLLLWHDRPIVRPVDDSVVRWGPSGVQVLRRARGYAPLPLPLKIPAATFLALGGHLKNTVAVSLGGLAADGTSAAKRLNTLGEKTPVVMSSHVGDLDHPLSVEVFRHAAEDLCAFFRLRPEAVVCDLHPDYASTREAEALATLWDAPCLRVQHHHAHVAACMAEHALTGPVLGLAWDGAGYGLDGTVWGGEVLLCRGAEFRRVAHWRTFPLPGGDLAVRQPRRSALGLLYEIFGPRAAEQVEAWFTPGELKILLKMLARKANCPRTSSVGRLFDAVAALCGLPPMITFEGQAAMALEFLAEQSPAAPYPLAIQNAGQVVNHRSSIDGSGATGGLSASVENKAHTGWQAARGTRQSKIDETVGQVVNLPHWRNISTAPMILDWEPMIRAILADCAVAVPGSRISARFHQTLVQGAVNVAKIVGLPQIVLSGGCFQNARLTQKMVEALRAEGFSVYTHQKVPPGDGGIALGQLYVAALTYKNGLGIRD